MKKGYRFLIVAAAALLCIALGRLYYHLTDDFRISNIVCDFVYRDDWETGRPLGAERTMLDQILAQEFTYLGKGAQAYAFQSADGRFVLKLFKFKHLKPSFWINLLPSISFFDSYKQMDQIKKHRKFYNVFTGYKVAHDTHKFQSGIVYAHLNQTLGMWPEIGIRDKLGFSHKVDLDRVVFVIQDKAEKTRDTLRRLLSAGDVEQAKEKIRQIIDLYLVEYSKGVYDRDHGVLHNTGFVADRAIHLDLGKFCKDDRVYNRDFYMNDLSLVISKFDDWLSTNYPHYRSEIVYDMTETLSKVI